MAANSYRNLPSVDRVLAEQALAEALAASERAVVVEAVRDALEDARASLAAGEKAPAAEAVAADAAARLARDRAPWPTPVINATGVILHTNLGRAPLSEASVRAAAAAAAEYSDLELDLETGKRSSRHRAVAALLRRLTGAEDAVVVNNNAGAVLLAMAALGAGREVVVARGEASEIGGGFRIPDVLRQSGARMVEVGTVNRTYARDYADAIGPETAAVLVVHRSNFRVVGFTHEAALDEVAAAAKQRGVPLLHDLGSGALLDTAAYGLAHEWTPRESIAAGAGLVFVSGDKLLGGPQAGIAVGEAALVERLTRHPLARPLRADKMTLAALHATLLHYLRGEAEREIPVWRMIAASAGELDARARAVVEAAGASARVVDRESTVGGGSLPGDT
ncbi:MAG: L-seryl-tRNA(Sec) selenium transferase, partial [Chloroflexota bacterium]|nr:L-seryl-tRNA(Sec) selenium transferase [Chloroflexota bacterium]